jgi:hypothetical protein
VRRGDRVGAASVYMQAGFLFGQPYDFQSENPERSERMFLRAAALYTEAGMPHEALDAHAAAQHARALGDRADRREAASLARIRARIDAYNRRDAEAETRYQGY